MTEIETIKWQRDAARDEIVRLEKQLAESKLEYDRLYAEWRQKNEACNKAYAITIPALVEALNEACDIAEAETMDETWSREQNKRTLVRIAELRNVGVL